MRMENSINGFGALPSRLTRSKATASSTLPPKPSVATNVYKQNACGKSKRAAPCPEAIKAKKRAVLGDVTNLCNQTLTHTEKTEIKKNKKHAIRERSSRAIDRTQSVQDFATSAAEDDFPDSQEKESALFAQCSQESEVICPDNEGKGELIDLDRDHMNPQMCSVYAVDIYSNLRASELVRRPHCNFMETIQSDITPSMRAILIDWLVEVSEEYKLVPDTLYLTVSIIDRFLSDSFLERQRLQLLGITSMLIAAKYEEICAPRVEELCFMTDNTYTRNDVLKMESEVLNLLNFRLSVPTVKTFLRRFLRAAQACYKAPNLSLEFLANYLAELTIVDYDFVRFLPSLIAASAVFLARWTLDDSSPPWNTTLEHYTRYRFSDLRAVAIELQELQVNAMNSPLRAIRNKYSQLKFKSVATMTPRRLQPDVFL